jgi:hypothetical protein
MVGMKQTKLVVVCLVYASEARTLRFESKLQIQSEASSIIDQAILKTL